LEPKIPKKIIQIIVAFNYEQLATTLSPYESDVIAAEGISVLAVR
jgi:hypothetical protein